jgi:hypothetical protein
MTSIVRPLSRSDRLAKRVGHDNPIADLQMKLQTAFLEHPAADLRRLEIFLTFISRRLAASDYQKALKLLHAAVSPSDTNREEGEVKCED